MLQSDQAAGGNGAPATYATTSGNLTLTKVGTVKFTATLLSPGQAKRVESLVENAQ